MSATELTAESAGVAVTGRAARRIAQILATEPPTSVLRVSVEGG
jgi:Fe-S cluster assembly iron-binding protein IscA